MSEEPIYEYVKGQGWVARARNNKSQKWACVFFDTGCNNPRWRNAERKGFYYSNYEAAQARIRNNAYTYQIWTAERENEETRD